MCAGCGRRDGEGEREAGRERGRERLRLRCQSSMCLRTLGNATINNLNSNWLAFGHKQLIISSADLY